MRKWLIRGVLFVIAISLIAGGLYWWMQTAIAPDPNLKKPLESENYQRRLLPRIPPDTKFQTEPPIGWSHIIQFVKGRIGQGDLEEVTGLMNQAAQNFNLVLMANVERVNSQTFRLSKVGAGFSTSQAGTNIIVTGAGNQKSQVELGFFDDKLLKVHQKSLDDFIQLARDENACLFESKIMLLLNGSHQQRILRYLIWVSPTTGTLSTCVWLSRETESNGQSTYTLAEPDFQLLPNNLQEDRVMHILGSRVFLGIPKEDAIAVVKIPQGTAIRFRDPIKELACRSRYHAESFQLLIDGMREQISEAGP